MRSGSPDVPQPTVVPYGDAAVLVSFGDVIDIGVNEAVHRLTAAIRSLGAPWQRPIPAYSSLLVPFDLLALDPDEAVSTMSAVVARASHERTAETTAGDRPDGPRSVTIDVRYGGPDGPDLGDVAERTGLTPGAVIEAHAGRAYRVFMLGFMPGFAYLGVLADELVIPRRATPRTRVPVGSVAIAERQTGVYPFASPGGWHLIGRTDARLWDPARERPSLLGPGDEVRFRPVSIA